MNVSRFLLWMQKRGWPVVLYVEPESGIEKGARKLALPTHVVRHPSDIAATWKSRTLAKQLANDRVRVLIIHQTRDLLMCALAKKWSGGSVRLIFSQNMHLGNKRDLIHAWQYRAIDAFVSPLPILAEQARQQTVVPPEKIHVIPHGIELDNFSSRMDRAQARTELGLSLDATIFGIIGRLDPKKGQHVGIQALARLHAKGLKAQLLIVGDPTIGEGDTYNRHLHSLVNELGLTGSVHFRPYQERPELAYGALDIFVLTSQSETYGLVTIEAMTSGLSVIGTDSGGTIDIIEHERNGLRFAPDDDAALADSLTRYINDPSFAARMAAQGKADALARYSHVKQCEAWEWLIREIVQ